MTGETIGLFGATGATGKYLLQFALEQGFKVQACVRTPSKVPADLQEKYKDSLTLVEGSFSDKEIITKTVKGANYVVSVAGGPIGKPKQYPQDLMFNFFLALTEVIKETNPSVKVVLYQAGAFSPTPDRPLPMVSNIIKTVVGQWIMGLGPNVDDNTKVVTYVHENLNTLGFQTIISRPGQLNDKPGGNEELKADFFSSTHFAITFSDLATWTLKAIQDTSLYGTFPFVVPIDKDILPRKKKEEEGTSTEVAKDDAGKKEESTRTELTSADA